MKMHSNIPFFIPHAGCRNSCVFCSQVKITGKDIFENAIEAECEALRKTVENSLKTLPNGTETQLAFFGGSFTGIEPERMKALLETGYKYVLDGSIKGIRISTRPDYINENILGLLRSFGVTDIELGIQSMNDTVLRASARGHTSITTIYAAAMVKKHGFGLVGQMMIGLPLSSLQDELFTAETIISMGADGARIYPVVVFSDTELFNMTLNGSYRPLSIEEAVERSAVCFERFIKANVSVLRIGLQSSESLSKAEFGANHPALGELVMARVYFIRLKELLGNTDCNDRRVEVFVADGEQSKLIGHGGSILRELKTMFGLKKISVLTGETEPYCPIIKVKE